ncbi:hypothetical protein ACFRH9_28390 [Peribacillus butanolivorans]|uniref:hypothetical protein n=1 Tax=Peribacillus butanolivorans TaxID=421767 RepID=UPI00366F6AD0
MRKILKVLGGLVIVMSLVACGEEDNVAEQVKSVETTADTLKEGENGYAGTNSILGVGKDDSNLKLITKYAGANNQTELQAMLAEGKAVLVDEGMPITLIERGVLSAKIKLTETGDVGWVPSEVISQDKPE